MENGINNSKINILSFEKFNKITKKDLYVLYIDCCNRINSQINSMNNYKTEIIDQHNVINTQSDYITKQDNELKRYKISIWILLIIIYLLVITLIVF